MTGLFLHCTRYENEWNGTYYFNESAVAEKSAAYADRMKANVESGKAVLREELTSYFNTYSPFDTQWAVGAYAYNMMLTRNGNCVHYAALLTVLLGHLGFDCRIIEGDFINADGSTYMHKMELCACRRSVLLARCAHGSCQLCKNGQN